MAPLKVCVIGGGPGAMFFCHAWNKQKQQGQVKQDLEITCFEQHATPGGIWRAHGSDPSLYEELWTNGCCYSLEFYDYTFQEHFGPDSTVPVYLPRKDISEYITERVTKHHTTFFDDFFKFQTRVLLVQESSAKDGKAFRITTKHLETGEITTTFFDKCIWAAGENCKGSIPATVRSMFESINQEAISFPASSKSAPLFELLHSTDTAQIRNCIQQKADAESQRGKNNVLLVGGGFSAEDLALQCLKWGADHVDIVVRNDEAEVTWTSQWPGPDKVQVHTSVAIQAVQVDGTISLVPVEYTWPCQYEWEEGLSSKTLRDIQTVVFCTGYQANLSMLEEALRPACGSIPAWYMGKDPTLDMKDMVEELSTWKMNPDNVAHKYTGDIAAGTDKMLRFNYNHPDMHRGICFNNPNLMFLCEHGMDVPLMSLDIHSWLLCSYLTGRLEMPSVAALRKANQQQVLDQMQIPFLRYFFDKGYCDTLEENSGKSYWNDGYWQSQKDYTIYMFRLLAKVMEEGKYPGKSLGTYEELNKNGNALIDFGMSSYYMRSDLKDYEEGRAWRTFRDDVIEPEYMHSLYTGHKARPLVKRWMDISTGEASVRTGAI